jgi:hypothetical protein
MATAACGGASDAGSSAAEWVGTVTTEGNVTTVVNESGSVWGGDVQLVEEVSIGVEAGEDAYMLGSVGAVWATDDEIYVVDRQVPALRVYDMGGRHLRDIGAEGSGPGEFRRPDSLAIGPQGRIYVRDYDNDRIMVFSPDGEEAGTLPLAGNFRTSTGIVMTVAGVLYSYQRIPSDDPEERTYGMVPRSLDGDTAGEPIPRPELEAPQGSSLSARSESMSIGMGVPFAPGVQWVVAPSGAVIAGVSDEYSFEIRYPDGAVTRVVRIDDPVPVDSAEADWHRKRITAQMRGYVADWSWNGDDIPEHKPAYTRFLPDHSGRIWVARPGPGKHVEGECDENPQADQERGASCWGESTIWEVFDDEGRFLGGAEVPDTLNAYSPTYIRDDVFIAALTDEMGTPMVKRYQLVYPDGK